MTLFRTGKPHVAHMAMVLFAATAPYAAAQHGNPADAMHSDDPLRTQVMIDQLEWRDQADDPTVLEGDAWIGYDLERLWLKVDGSHSEGSVGELELQALYSRGITPFWDLQLGLRHDDLASTGRNWAVLALHGLAPYFLESEVELFLGESGATAFRMKAEYDALLTQRLVLSPELKMELHGQNDVRTGTGSGLSSVTAGLRLRYEIHRQFAPYTGIRWQRRYGQTADYHRESGQPVQQTHWVAGVRIWF